MTLKRFRFKLETLGKLNSLNVYKEISVYYIKTLLILNMYIKEKQLLANKRYKEKYPEKYKEIQKQYFTKWRAANIEKVNEYDRKRVLKSYYYKKQVKLLCDMYNIYL